MDKYNSQIRLYWHDRILQRTILCFIPRQVTPNTITAVRFAVTPVVLLLITLHNYSWGIPLFLFAAFTDALDGSLARTRRQITEWGIVYDPIADKVLINLVLLIFVSRHLSFALGVAIVTMETVSALTALVLKRRGYVYMATKLGKTKMVLQVAGLFFLLLSAASHVQILYDVSFVVLFVSLVFAVVNTVTFGLRKE